MKQKYIVISSFFIALFLLSILCFISYKFAEHRQDANRKETPMKYVTSSTDVRIDGTTAFFVETYYLKENTSKKEKKTLPLSYIGLTRIELENKLKNQKRKKGEKEIQLISFSKETVIIRKVYDTVKEERGFYLKTLKGEVAIYNRTGEYLYEKTGILVKYLPKDERKKLEKGYFVPSEKDLYSILENFSS